MIDTDTPETITLTYSALRALLESVAAGDSIYDAMLTATDELDVARIGGPLGRGGNGDQ